jgi:mono/diheme cytochrome c family protein
MSITALNLRGKRVIDRHIPSSEPPAPGTFDHGVLLGKLVFHTALGVPDNGIFDTPIRSINTLANVGKASDTAWSTCASCHPDGLADGVTWVFADGPRQTLPLDASHSKKFSIDQRIFNWSAARSSSTDFNNNPRAVQGGCGFASDDFAPTPCPPAGVNLATHTQNPGIYDHGLAQGASDALDAMSLWIETVRAPILPPAGNAGDRNAGRDVFDEHCKSCHGGAKWTKSQVIYADNPAFFANPAAGGTPRDPGVTNAGAEIRFYTVDPPGAQQGDPFRLDFLEKVATFDADDPLEIRGLGAASGTTALGARGFNVPSLLGLRYHAPYLHNGSAANLNQVFQQHRLAGVGKIADLSAAEKSDLIAFLNSITGATDTVSPSDTDQFQNDISGVAP